MDRQVQHLTQLVDDLLDINRITTGTIRLRREPVRLREVIERSVEASRPVLAARDHEFTVSVPEQELVVTGDRTRLTQVVNNLLNNAAKYTPQGGRVRLTLEQDEQYALIRVQDNGVGIPQDMLDSVFDLFKQGDRSLDRSEGGLGIGLTLVRELVARQLGSVEVRSEGSNEGSEFIVRLPLALPEEATKGRSTRKNGMSDATDDYPRVMVVDDNPDIAESMQMLLEMWGFEVETAGEGTTALQKVQTFRPRIVLLDIGLPVMNGYEVAEKILALPDLPEMVLIALTGYGQREDLQRSEEAGFRHHLVKPADPDELLSLLQEISATLSE